ncbi:hypothetical protein OE88DRAFT_1649818 [Heliocybe sulcata]|uniref:Uncharacterized protein n=1 Tax=Heliocybe sulcata TaxID=5364 RepID=A0A5C3NGI1_9AGAM|nr:hypothetical protein OE88DRAFT_1649818 [Heliocybe sulcata]
MFCKNLLYLVARQILAGPRVGARLPHPALSNIPRRMCKNGISEGGKGAFCAKWARSETDFTAKSPGRGRPNQRRCYVC